MEPWLQFIFGGCVGLALTLTMIYLDKVEKDIERLEGKLKAIDDFYAEFRKYKQETKNGLDN